MSYDPYHSATFGLTIDPFLETPTKFAATGAASRPGQSAAAIKEKFLNQRMLKARVKMPPELARTEHGKALQAQRGNRPIVGACA